MSIYTDFVLNKHIASLQRVINKGIKNPTAETTLTELEHIKEYIRVLEERNERQAKALMELQK